MALDMDIVIVIGNYHIYNNVMPLPNDYIFWCVGKPQAFGVL